MGGSQKWNLGVKKTGDPEVGGGARSGAGEPEVNRELTTSLRPRARSLDHQFSFGIIPDGILEHFTFIRVWSTYLLWFDPRLHKNQGQRKSATRCWRD